MLRRIKEWFRLKYLQYFRFHGIHPYDVWNPSWAMAKYMLPILREHLTLKVNGVPGAFIKNNVSDEEFDSMDYDIDALAVEWEATLKRIYASLEMFANDDYPDYNTPEMDEYERGMKEFGLYWHNIWD